MMNFRISLKLGKLSNFKIWLRLVWFKHRDVFRYLINNAFVFKFNCMSYVRTHIASLLVKHASLILINMDGIMRAVLDVQDLQGQMVLVTNTHVERMFKFH